MSALPPIATAKADMPQMVMSASPPKADMCSVFGMSACASFKHDNDSENSIVFDVSGIGGKDAP